MGEDSAERRGVLRGVVLATLTALLTVAGHAAGGGALPDLAVLAVLLPLLAGALTAVADRSRSAVGALAVLGGGQLALHQLIEALSPAGDPAHGAHGVHLVAASGTAAVAAPPGFVMFGAHAVATLVIAAALRFADRAVAAVRAALRRVVPRRLTPLSADRPLPTLATAGPAISLGLARTLAVAHVRRGPPVRC
jgi:hypothetical protein